MRGRYTLLAPPEELETRFDATLTHPLSTRYNCAPDQELPIVTNDAPGEFRFLRWGLVSLWIDSISVGNNRINARTETIREKQSFANAYEARRCLVPSNGFYKWVDRGGREQSHRVAFEDNRSFAMADLWERWTASTEQIDLGNSGSGDLSRKQEPFETLTVVTTESSSLVSELHRRMVVVLAPEDEQTWFHGNLDKTATLLDTYPDDEFAAYPVSMQVSSPANDGPDLVERVEVQHRMESLASSRPSDFDANRPGSTGPRVPQARSDPRIGIAYSEIEYTSSESDKPPATEALRESGTESR